MILDALSHIRLVIRVILHFVIDALRLAKRGSIPVVHAGLRI